MTLSLDQLEDTHCILDGETVPAGLAAKKMRERWGTVSVRLTIIDGIYRVSNLTGSESIDLPIAPPREQTASARGNEAKRRAAIARAAK